MAVTSYIVRVSLLRLASWLTIMYTGSSHKKGPYLYVSLTYLLLFLCLLYRVYLGATCWGYRCDSGECTALTSDRCDGSRDCSDGSDEQNCQSKYLTLSLHWYLKSRNPCSQVPGLYS